MTDKTNITDVQSCKTAVNVSYIKCWNCKYFQIENISDNRGKCHLHECKVDYPKWQHCESYDKCGNLR